jgi:type II secretory pathway pseudopilin PulG
VRRGEAGYNLVILIVAITVLNILVAAALPLWSQVIRRDKERELISRGLQYAEAIRVFKQRFGRPPVRLEELVEVEPRCIRQLWKDPMTKSGRWALVFEGAEDAGAVVPPSDGRAGGPRIGGDPTGGGGVEEGEGGDTLDPDAPPGAGGEVAVGPIAGVRSRSREESIMVFLGQNRYDRWIFRPEIFAAAQRMNAVGNPNLAPFFNPNWWRPFRGGLQAPGLDQLPPPPGTPPPGTPPPGPNQKKPPTVEPN